MHLDTQSYQSNRSSESGHLSQTILLERKQSNHTDLQPSPKNISHTQVYHVRSVSDHAGYPVRHPGQAEHRSCILTTIRKDRSPPLDLKFRSRPRLDMQKQQSDSQGRTHVTVNNDRSQGRETQFQNYQTRNNGTRIER